ncbi:MAG TPA: hypothetical protein EYO82_01140, partial [Gammaproteobacteria bacterium]|nr:hypothetical protein [Gammaproteobacteria bacterium]
LGQLLRVLLLDSGTSGGVVQQARLQTPCSTTSSTACRTTAAAIVISPGAIRTLSSAGIKDFPELMRVACIVAVALSKCA